MCFKPFEASGHMNLWRISLPRGQVYVSFPGSYVNLSLLYSYSGSGIPVLLSGLPLLADGMYAFIPSSDSAFRFCREKWPLSADISISPRRPFDPLASGTTDP